AAIRPSIFLSRIALQACSNRSLWPPAKYPCGFKVVFSSTTNPRRVSSAIPAAIAAPSAGEEGERMPIRDPLRSALGFCSRAGRPVIRDGLPEEALQQRPLPYEVALQCPPAGDG